MPPVDDAPVRYQPVKTRQDSSCIERQLDNFPSQEEIEELCSVLRVSDLRQLTAEILNASITYLREDTDRKEYVTLLSSWIATTEETVAAGRNANRIAARRKAMNGE